MVCGNAAVRCVFDQGPGDYARMDGVHRCDAGFRRRGACVLLHLGAEVYDVHLHIGADLVAAIDGVSVLLSEGLLVCIPAWHSCGDYHRAFERHSPRALQYAPMRRLQARCLAAFYRR